MNQYLAQHLSSTAKDYIEMREAEVEAYGEGYLENEEEVELC